MWIAILKLCCVPGRYYSMRFEARHGDDRYPIGRLILQRAADLGLSRSEVVRRLGYQKADKGHRKLNRLLSSGVISAQIGCVLTAALEVEPGTVQAAISETAAQRRAEEQARRDAEDAAYRVAFQPHLRAEVERAVPTPLFVAIVYGPALRIVPVADEAWTTDDVARRRLIKRAVVCHYRSWRGRLPSYGKITGYVAISGTVGHFDLGVPYGADGAPVGSPMVVERVGVGALTIKGHPIPSKWFQARTETVGDGKRCGTLEWPATG
jgi:hypothetical protein